MATHILEENAPTVNPIGASPNDRENINATPDMFGASVGHAEQGLGQAVTGAGTTALDINTAHQQLTNEVHNSDVNTWLSNAITDRYSKFQKLEGRAAQDGIGAYKNDIHDLYQQAMQQAPDLASQAQIAKAGSALVDQFYKYGTLYADGQFKTWQNRSTTDRAQSFGNNAAMAASNADLPGMEVALSVSDDEIRKKFEAQYYGADEIGNEVSKNRGTNVGRIVQQIATSGLSGSGTPDLATANAVFNRYKDQMDVGSRLAITKFLEPRLQKQSGEDLAHQEIGLGPLRVNAGERDLMIRTIAGEAGHEGEVGQAAVASVIKNRVLSGGFGGDNVNDVIKARKQFSVWNVGDPAGDVARGLSPDSPQYQRIGSVVDGVLSGRIKDPTGGASHYYNPHDASPDWGPKLAATNDITIGNHRFVGKADTSGAMQTPGVDKATAIRGVMDKAGDNIAVRNYALAEINKIYSAQNAASATARQALSIDVPNQIQAAENGDLNAHIDEAAIRSAYPAPRAEAMIDQFAIAKNVGVAISGIQYASPDEVNDAAHDLSSGQGHLSEMLKTHKNYGSTGAATVAADPSDPLEGAFFKNRAHAQLAFQKVVDQRSKALFGTAADPAAFVAGEPSVNAAMLAAQKDPSKLQDYVNATLGVQSHVGVPPEQQHIFTRAQAMNVAQNLMADGTDVRARLNSLQQMYGPNYSKVFSDLVSLGKLPPSYQAIAGLPDKDDADLLARGLRQASKAEDGKEQPWAQTIAATTGDTKAADTMKTSIDSSPTVQKYMRSLIDSGASKGFIDNVAKDMQTLAYSKVFWNKMSTTDAVQSAIDGFTKTYDFPLRGSARVPSVVSGPITDDTNTLLSHLSPDNMTLPANVGGHGQASAADYIADTRAAHTWINTKRGDGITLLDGGGKQVLDKSGQPYTIKFADAGRLSASAPVRSAPMMNDPMVNALALER